MRPLVKRGTATRLGLRLPGPRFILTFPKDMSPEVVERFIAEWEASRSHPLFVDLRPTQFTYPSVGIDVHSTGMEEQRPRRRWWRWSR